jgi:hypothetical protein
MKKVPKNHISRPNLQPNTVIQVKTYVKILSCRIQHRIRIRIRNQLKVGSGYPSAKNHSRFTTLVRRTINEKD